MQTTSVLVIGAGVGGLTAAIHLARRGLHVTVLEKNARSGGRCDRLSRAGHTFDTGPTLFVMPLLYEAEFRALGASMRELLELQRVDPTYRLVFEDGSQLALTSDRKRLCEQLEKIEAGSFRELLRYLREGKTHYELGLDRLVGRSFRKATDFFCLPNLVCLLRLKPFLQHYRHMSAYFDDPRLKAAFTFQDIYMGLSPFEAAATFSLLPYTELAHGVWYPKGGMYSVVEALECLARAQGVEFVFDAVVERIGTSRARATGVQLGDGTYLPGDILLANADLPYVYQELLPRAPEAEALLRRQYSCSVISFFWGLDRPYGSLGPHTLFLADDYRRNFDAFAGDEILPPNPSLYLHAPARLDPMMAPPGADSLTAIVPVGHMREGAEPDWGALRERARGHVLRRLRTLGITDLEAHIKFEETYLPPSWRKRYNLVNGSTHGLSHTLTQMAYFRPANRHRRYRNLYFVGASTHPGTGMPTAMVSGRLAAERILDELGT